MSDVLLDGARRKIVSRCLPILVEPRRRDYLHHLVELEVLERRRRRIEPNQRQSELPGDKTLATLKRSRLPAKVGKMLPTLCEGGFVERGDNLLAFGLPGRGKTHFFCAIGHELIYCGYRVLFVATYVLVQRLLVAKRDLVVVGQPLHCSRASVSRS